MSLKISIVTPSYNQVDFIEETILSVLGQNYDNIEYIVIDGGSSDGSVDIIKQYEKHINYWVSEPDRGQSHAINKGFEIATGDILCWLNSDDCFLPGALSHVADLFQRNPKKDFLTGGWWVLEPDGSIAPVRPTGVGMLPSLALLLGHHGCIGQHSTFWRHELFQKAGPIREELNYAMDHELWIRMFQSGATPLITARNLAIYRQQPLQKTQHKGINGNSYYCECQKIMKDYRIKYGNLVQFKSKFSARIYKLLKHRNIHPRLGLRPPLGFDIDYSEWLQGIKHDVIMQ